ncbi:MAG TPA: hypothetical protein VD757_01415, partial [Candidatus Nitrosocosmicus sp.]|nr:hypothetical protein [Candidatus Nitrosocosmicus sp.]
STYAALEELADILDEPINRDETGKAYYAIRSDQKIYLTGVDVNGEFYVKIKELQKLDYSVYWNPYTGEVTVWRSNDQSVLDSLKTI